MKIRITLFAAFLVATLTTIVLIFWKQEIQYALPTPVPANFVDVPLGSRINLQSLLPIPEGKPALLHFFSFNCSCSRFNMKEFESMAREYGDEIYFAIVLQSEDEDDIERFNKKYELNLPVVLDKKGSISNVCGIYATPQAVILDRDASLYFKGNYNAARFCTRKETKFAELALGHLLKGEPLPMNIRYALTEPYGCTLPSDDDESKQITSLFNLF